jgi:hypothetical protein
MEEWEGKSLCGEAQGIEIIVSFARHLKWSKSIVIVKNENLE